MRVTAVFIALINLAVLDWLGEDGASFRAGDASWSVVLADVLVAVVAGLAVSEIVLRRLRTAVLAEKFSDRYANLVAVVGLGGTLMGFLLAGLVATSGALNASELSVPLATLPVCLMGTVIGLMLGLLEGLFLAFPWPPSSGGSGTGLSRRLRRWYSPPGRRRGP